MNHLFPPPMRQFLCALRHAPQQLADSQVGAELWLSEAQAGLTQLEPLLLRSEQCDEWLRQLRLDFREIDKLLHNKAQQAAPERAEALEAVLRRYYAQLFALQQYELQRPTLSPMLPIDQLLKVAVNLLHGTVEVFELQQRIGSSAAYVAALARELEARQRLFDEISWPQPLNEALQQIHGGLGALIRFLESAESQALEDGIVLLGTGSTQFARLLEETLATVQPRYVPQDSLECWLRWVDFQYDLGPAVADALWQRLYHQAEDLGHRIQVARRSGLGVAEPELVARAEQLRSDLLERLQQCSAEPLPSAVVQEKLGPLFLALEPVTMALRGRADELQEQLKSAPRLLDLLELICQVDAGLLPPWVLRAELQQQLELQAQSQAAFENLGEAHLLPLIASHQPALQRLLLFCEDGNREHLLEGWKLLALTLPPLLQFDRQVRETIARSGKSGQQVTCVRCGLAQPPQRLCRSCQAILPQTELDNTVYQDIVGGDNGPAAQVADHLGDLIQGLAFGTATWEQVGDEILKQLDKLTATRTGFERELLQVMGKDHALDAYCQFFIVKLGQLSTTLLTMGESVKMRQMGPLQAQMTPYRELHEELQAFQTRIDEGLGKK